MSAHHLLINKSLADSVALPLATEGLNWLSKSGMLEDGWEPDLKECSAVYITEASQTPPVGVLCFRPDGSGLVVELMYVEPSRRRTGLLRALMDRLRSYAQKNGMEFIELSIAAQNEAALDAIEALGFETAAYRYKVALGSGDGREGRILGTARS